MNFLTAIRPRNVQAERRGPLGDSRRAEKTRALLVNGQMQTVGELRSSYANGTARLFGQNLGILSGNYAPEQVAEAYKTGVTTFIGVNVRCGISAEIPIHATDASGEAVDDSPAQIFIDSAPKYIWRLLAYQLIFGAIYIRKLRNRHGYPTGLEILSPLDVTPELDYSKGTVARYCIRRPVGMEYVTPADMIVDVTFNPFSDVDGTSAVEVAKVRSDIETAIGRYGAMFFANSARPDLVITTDAEMSEDQQKEARTRWEANFKGVLNSFRAAFLGGSKWEVKPIGYNPSDLAMVELTSQADMKILAVMRVAPILAGIGHASDPLSAQGTYEQARTQHLEFVAIPDVRQLCNVLNEQWLHKDFTDSPTTWTLEPDTAAILSSAMGTSDRITAANTAVAGHYWRVNEAREHTGKEPLPYAIDMNPDWAVSLYDKGLITRRQALAAVGYIPQTITAPEGYIWELDPRAKAPPAPPPPFGMFGPPQQNPPGQNIAATEPPKQIAAPKSADAETITVEPVPARRSVEKSAQLHELGLWASRVKKKGYDARFSAELLPAEIVSFVRSSLDERWNPPHVFETAKEYVRTGQQPALGASAADAEAYWKNYNELKHDLGAGWLGYQQVISSEVFSRVIDGQMPTDDIFAKNHSALLSDWVGTSDNPGALTMLLVAGQAAGDVMLQKDKGLKPGQTRALSVGVDWSLVSEDALTFARSYALNLIRDIDATTQDGVRSAIQQQISQGLSKDKLADLISGVLTAPGSEPSEAIRARADMIAQTEAVRAYNEGSFERWRQAGVRESTWQTVRDSHVCPRCFSVHGTRAAFDTGWRSAVDNQTLRPPRHPSCRCFTRPVLPELGS